MEKTKLRVCVCPLVGIERQNWLCPDLAMNLIQMAGDPRFDVTFAPIRDQRPFDVARNAAIVAARDSHADWVCMIDNDCFLVGGTPQDVIAQADPCKQAIIGLTSAVGGMNPATRQADFRLFPTNEAITQEGAFLEVPHTGGACMMIHRSVWEKLPMPLFKWVNGSSETGAIGLIGDGDSEEVYFCKQARAAGFRVWLHARAFAGHYRTVDLVTMSCTLIALRRRVQELEKCSTRPRSQSYGN